MTTDLFLASRELLGGPHEARKDAALPAPASVNEVEPAPLIEPQPAAKRAAKPASKAPARGDRDVFEASDHTVDLESILAELESPPAVAHASTESVEVDLSIVLDDISRSEGRADASVPGDLDGAFAPLRDEASRRSAMEEAERQYERGLVLREAGDIEGCILALQAASQGPRLRFLTSSLLARILRDRGMNPQAIEWFEKAAQASAPTAEEEYDLLYDLADVLEREGEVARALAISLELQVEAGAYRDVAARIDRLTRV